MTATDPNVLLEEAKCLGCHSGATLAERLKLAFWQRISLGPVRSFITRAGLTDPTQIQAVSDLAEAAMLNGWWDKCDLIYPFVGGTAQAHAQNLKSSSFAIIWNGAVAHNSSGITGDGATGYGDTGYVPNSSGQVGLNSVHLGIYRRTNGQTLRNHLGSSSLGTGSSLTMDNASGAAPIRIRANDNTLSSMGPGASSLAFAVMTRFDAANKHLYHGALDEIHAIASIAVPNFSIYILARNLDGAMSGPSNVNLAGATVGSGLTFSEYASMRNDFQAFNTALGRQV